MRKLFFLILFILFIISTACRREKPIEYTFQFEKQTWSRFSNVIITIPLKENNKTYEVNFFARFTHDYPHETLIFNMIMTTPSGEERIMEYQIKKIILGEENQITLKKDLFISKSGNLVLELENLMPQLHLSGISMIGVRLILAGK